jgi:hypothetical protein
MNGRFPLILMTIFALALGVSACDRKDEPSQFDAELQKFIEFRTAQNFAGEWASSSQRFRAGNPGGQAALESYAKSFGIHPTRIEVLRTAGRADMSVAEVKVQYSDDRGESAGVSIENWTFVLEDGHWRYDHSQTLSESKP